MLPDTSPAATPAFRWLHRIENLILALVFAAMLFLAAGQIVQRNLTGGGAVWTDELLRNLVLWIALLGAMAASRTTRHIGIDVVTRFLPARLAKVVQALTMLCTSGICAVIAYYSWVFVDGERAFGGSVLGGGVPSWVVLTILLAGFAVIAVRYAYHSYLAARSAINGVEETP